MPMKSIIQTTGWVIVFLAISSFIGMVTKSNMDWYETLPKSPLNPPRLAFPIVWTTLYIMLAVAGSRLWSVRKEENGQKLMPLFAAYMLVNWAWSFIFFAGHMVGFGFIWILLSDAILLTLIIKLYQSNKRIETTLLIPTLIWGLFAAYLNGYIYFMMG